MHGEVVEAASRRAAGGVPHTSQFHENEGHLLACVVMKILGNPLTLISADMFDLVLQFLLLRFRDAQRLGDETILLDQPQAIAAQFVGLLHGKTPVPFGP
ncbi:hypothetical protein BHK69_18420 [Bosea vaviloviae]|uniref:Uncharacterized protein n=1 Tax=Bosea vaviloviae TaxID=1526658 RepID=A0A1D7U493_9HYPH|nr:hypothetical protein BHK69_18420 [Bosea vaviloviae]